METSTNTGSQKSRAGIYIAIGIGVIFALAISLAVSMDYSREARGRRDSLLPSAIFAESFFMECAANPEMASRHYELAVSSNPMAYSEVRFVMQLPPDEQVEKGIIYFAPSERTQDSLDYFNIRIAAGQSSGKTSFPVTMDELVTDQKAISDICKEIEFDYLVYEEFNHDTKASMLDRLYGEIFMLRGAWRENDSGVSIFLDKDYYVAAAVSIDSFITEAPVIDGIAENTLYIYPHGDGHTDTLIANLNGIIAEQPGLLEGTGLSAPLTLEDVLDDREAVWKVIHRLDSAQMARFRTH